MKSVLAILFITFAAVSIVFYYKKGTVLSCKSELTVIKKNTRLDMITMLSLSSGKGVMTISGVLYDGKDTSAHISKNIRFTYEKNGEIYILKSDIIVNSPLMVMSPELEKKWFPGFYSHQGQVMVLKIRPVGEQGWFSYSGVVPQYLCEKEP